MLNPVNGNAQIGTVTVGGDWIASNLVAGVEDTGGDGFGNGTEAVIGGGTLAKIAAVTINGTIIGTAAGGDHFGFESHQIGSFQVGGTSMNLIPLAGADAIDYSPLTAYDISLREV